MYLHRSISTTLEVLKTTSTYTSKASLRSSKINIFDISILKAKTQGLFKLKNKRNFFLQKHTKLRAWYTHLPSINNITVSLV